MSITTRYRPRSQIRSTQESQHPGIKVGGILMLALAVAGAIYMYPEMKRYINIRRM